MIPYFPTSIRPDYTMGAINVFRNSDSPQPTKRRKYAKLILGQMLPGDAQNFIRHYARGESFDTMFGDNAAAFEEGRRVFEITLKMLITVVRMADHPFPSLQWPLKQVHIKSIDQYFPELVKAKYVRLPTTFEQARAVLGITEAASQEDLLEALLQKLEENNPDRSPLAPHRASRLEEQRRCHYLAWKALGGENAIYGASHVIEDRCLVE